MGECKCKCKQASCSGSQRDILYVADSMTRADMHEAVNILCNFIKRITVNADTVNLYRASAETMMQNAVENCSQ